MNNDVHFQARATARGGASSAFTWTGGIVLVLLGTIFLLRNAGVIETWGNWWALFILIPAVAMAGTAWAQYRAAGRRLTAAAGPIVGSLTLAAVAAIFLLNLSWGALWPVFLIITGAAALLQWSCWRRGGSNPP